jgi:hypothetical protein
MQRLLVVLAALIGAPAIAFAQEQADPRTLIPSSTRQRNVLVLCIPGGLCDSFRS